MTERIDGIIDRVSNEEHFSDIEWILKAPVENLAWSVVDDTMKANAEFQYKAGLPAKVVRKTEASGIRTVRRGNKTISYKVPCRWCQQVAGTYTYPNVPRDVWKRHDGCECIIEYTPAGGGPGQVLKGNSKGWVATDEELAVRRNARPVTVTLTKEEQEQLQKIGTGAIVESSDMKKTGPGKVIPIDGDTRQGTGYLLDTYDTLADEYGGTISLAKYSEPYMTGHFDWNGEHWNWVTSGADIDGVVKYWTNRQVDGFVFDIRQNPITQSTKRLSTVEKEAKEALKKYATRPTDVIIMQDGKILSSFRYEI